MYCPKLCRAACPVSNAEASETVTPWGKMSTAYFAARGNVPLDAGHAATAWACTSCFACRDMCQHKNPVAVVLGDARVEAFARGVAPEPAAALARGWFDRAAEVTEAIDVIATQTDTDRAQPSETALLFGCGYARRAPDVARDAVQATMTLTGSRVRPVRACCGLPLLQAGDHDGFVAAARRLAAEVAKAPRVVAVDPGCARTLLVEYARIGVKLPKVELFLDLVANDRGKLRALSPDEIANAVETARSAAPSPAPSSREGASPLAHSVRTGALGAAPHEGAAREAVPSSRSSVSDAAASSRSSSNEAVPSSRRGVRVRWHDPCQLGRGLGRFDEPRAILDRLAQGAVGFPRERAMGECSGGGGLLPITRPDTSLAIAEARLAEHRTAGGGVLVTHCASSLHRFRTAGEPAVDLTTLVARALTPQGRRS